MKKSRWVEFSVGLLIIFGILLFFVLAFKVGGLRWWEKYNIYKIPAKDVLGIVDNSSVMIAGVEVGRIKKIKVDWNRAIIVAELNKNIHLTQGTRFRIRGKSLLGEKYLQVIPGGKNAPLLPTDKILNTWAEHETEIGDFMTKMDKKYIPTPEQAQKLTQAMLFLLYDNRDNIGSILSWFKEITEKLPAKRVEKLLNLIESDLFFLEKLKHDYPDFKNQINELSGFLKELHRDYSAVKSEIKKVDLNKNKLEMLTDKTFDILELTEALLNNLNFQLHKFDNVDFETLKELMQDEGFKIRILKRSKKEKEKDLKLFRSYPRENTGN